MNNPAQRQNKRSLFGVGEPLKSYLVSRRVVRSQFRTSLMSNSKWRRLFSAIEDMRLDLNSCRIKWIDGERTSVGSTPNKRDLAVPRAFMDYSEWSAFPLCEIEWIEFPRNVLVESGLGGRKQGQIIHQDIDRAATALSALAKFPIEIVNDALRIVGYVR